MLPESTLREIRMSRAAQWTRSPELGVTHVDKKSTATTPAPIEPLSLDESAAAAEDSVAPRASAANKGSEIKREDCQTSRAAQTLEQAREIEPEHKEPEHKEPEQKPVEEDGEQRHDSPTAGLEDDEEEGDLPIMIIGDEPVTPTTPVPTQEKPSMHRRLPSKTLPPLPTIPEIIATGPDDANIILSPTSTPLPPGVTTRANTDDYVYLDSTPYTMTHPTFRHGPVRLAKADLPIGKLAAAVDDTLDWTAFQMAILGGAGDFFSEPTDYSKPSDMELDELDEIYNWFTGFGFVSAGGLVTSTERRPSASKESSNRRPSEGHALDAHSVEPRTPGLSPSSNTSSTPNSSPRTVIISGQRSPGIVRIDPPMGDSPSKTGSSAARNSSIASRVLAPPEFHKKHRRSVSSGTFSMGQSFSDKDKNVNGLAIDSAKRPNSTDSMQSLPQSPMMELVLTHDVHGNEVPVPMGYNMSHDARDFLVWHTEHVSL